MNEEAIDPLLALFVMLEGWQDAAPEMRRAYTLERYADRVRVHDRAYQLVLREDARPEGERSLGSCTDTRPVMLLAWLSPKVGINGAEWMRLYTARTQRLANPVDPPLHSEPVRK